MFFRKKPKRLYYPTKSRWYTRPRRRPNIISQKRFNPLGVRNTLAGVLKNRMATLVTVFCLAVFVLILASSSYMAITNIEVLRENFNVNSTAIESELNIYIGKNLLFFPRYKIARTIQEKFPEFSTININKEFPDTLKISLVSHPIVANLRAYYVLPSPEEKPPQEFSALNQAIQEIDVNAANISPLPRQKNPLEDQEALISSFSLDPQKKKKELAPKPVEQKSLLNYIGQTIFDREENLELMTIYIRGLSQPIEDRQQVIPPAHMDYVRETMNYFNNSFDLEILGINYLPIAREIHVITKKNLQIRMTTEKDYKQQLDKLKTIYEPAELNREDVAYIDLRVKEKVIYCPRGSACSR